MPHKIKSGDLDGHSSKNKRPRISIYTDTPLFTCTENLTELSASQEIPCILRKPRVHYRVYKSRPPVHFMSQINPIHIPKPHFPKINFNIILPSTSRSSESFLPVRLSNTPLPCAVPTPPPHLTLLQLVSDEDYNVWSSRLPLLHTSPTHLVLTHHRSAFFPSCDRSDSTSMKTNKLKS
jgi:hypothetical protein